MNRSFTRTPASKEDVHVPLLDVNVTNIMCLEYERVVSNDRTVRFEKWLFQILKAQGNWPQPKKQVTVRKKLDGTISILWNGNPLKIKELLSNKEVKQPGSTAACYDISIGR
jgi:hypothetical protein